MFSADHLNLCYTAKDEIAVIYGVAEAFAREGARVFLAGRDHETVELSTIRIKAKAMTGTLAILPAVHLQDDLSIFKNLMMKTALLTQIDTTKAELLEILSSLSGEQLNQVPFSGSWTAGQVGEHLQKACSAELLYGKTKPTERDPTAMVEPIKKIFLDFSIKMNSPDFIYPEKDHHEKEELQQSLDAAWTDIRGAADTLDLTLTCDFEIPGFGALTRFELISFMVVHTQRHLHQLRNIREKLAA